jgi:hypothetical protein
LAVKLKRIVLSARNANEPGNCSRGLVGRRLCVLKYSRGNLGCAFAISRTSKSIGSPQLNRNIPRFNTGGEQIGPGPVVAAQTTQVANV